MLTYELAVETPPDPNTDSVVRLHLTDDTGAHCGSHHVRLADHSAARWEGVFDTRRYVERYANALRGHDGQLRSAEQILDEVGVFLGQHVLGPDITAELARSKQRRTLLVRLPATESDVLAAAFARIPWEIARPGPDQAPLMERALVVRAVTESTNATDAAVRKVAETLAQTQGVLRVLIVFAEAPGSRPLAMRLERERLRQLFEEEILPKRNVQVDVLCHGVTRDEVRERITASSGYHIVHWSGHGHHNGLELLTSDGGAERITGEALVKLMIDAPGGFVPQLFFLSACHSGAFVGTRRWSALQETLRLGTAKADRGEQPTRSLAEVLDLNDAPGYTGTALALLRSGVPQVVAMRYSVGDDYARELGWWFYKRLLADDSERTPADALAQARTDVLREHPTSMMPVDHANPLVFGADGIPIRPAKGRGPQMGQLRPRPQPLLPGGGRELNRRELFVGRGTTLTQINRAWQKGGSAVTVVQGLAGLGKTALASEAIHLWYGRFAWVLAFAARPIALTIEEFLRQVDLRLAVASAAYRDKCDEAPYERVYLEQGRPLQGQARYDQMRTNLVEALRDEAVLLVLDNFDTNLEREPREGGRYACADPHWDQMLEVLSEELSATRSRVLITTRHRPKALSSEGTLWLPLGPLTTDEMALYVHSHAGLSAMLRGDDEARRLLRRALGVSRGHPLILERLATLVVDPKALVEACSRFENEGYKALPELTVSLTEAQREAERTYLQDVAEGSVDVLLERLSPPARRLLWMVTLAHEPVTERMLAVVWTEQTTSKSGRRRRPTLPRLLVELHEAGLLDRPEPVATPATENEPPATYDFHELVQERVAVWIEAHPEERSERAAEQVWVGYGQHYLAMFRDLFVARTPGAREVAAEAGRRAVLYLTRAGELSSLASFASRLVTSSRDSVLLGHVVAQFRAVADQVPEGKPRWSLHTCLADALTRSGRPAEALPIYAEAEHEASAAEHWADIAWICANQADALILLGRLDQARASHLRSADASRRAGRPLVHIVGRQIEALRIEVMQGRAAAALPEIERILPQLVGWWVAHAQGKVVADAPNAEFLGRALLGALDIAWQANLGLERWGECLELTAKQEALKRALGESEHELTITSFNQYGPLLRLGRLDDAQQVLERCLDRFRTFGDPRMESAALGALGELWSRRGDRRHATELGRQALALSNRLSDPEYRAVSHENLAVHLEHLAELERAAEHRLAGVAYRLASSRREQLSVTVRSLALAKQQAAAAGRSYTLPRLGVVLALPAFEPLHRFLSDRHVDLDALQAAIDQVVVRA